MAQMTNREKISDGQRSTWRLSTTNYDYVQRRAEEMGISMNGALNVIIAEMRRDGTDANQALEESRSMPKRITSR